MFLLSYELYITNGSLLIGCKSEIGDFVAIFRPPTMYDTSAACTMTTIR